MCTFLLQNCATGYNAVLLPTNYIYKSQNAPGPYPTIHHSEQKCAHFCSELCTVGYRANAIGICEIGPLCTLEQEGGDLHQHWFRLSVVITYSAPSHYLNQCWIIDNWTPGNNLHIDFNQNAHFFIAQENASGCGICKIFIILLRLQCAKLNLFSRENVCIQRKHICYEWHCFLITMMFRQIPKIKHVHMSGISRDTMSPDGT